MLSASGWDVFTTDLGFYEASFPSSVTTSTSAEAKAAHSASGMASAAHEVTSKQRNQTTLCFHPLPRHDTQRRPQRASTRTSSMGENDKGAAQAQDTTFELVKPTLALLAALDRKSVV